MNVGFDGMFPVDMVNFIYDKQVFEEAEAELLHAIELHEIVKAGEDCQKMLWTQSTEGEWQAKPKAGEEANVTFPTNMVKVIIEGFPDDVDFDSKEVMDVYLEEGKSLVHFVRRVCGMSCEVMFWTRSTRGEWKVKRMIEEEERSTFPINMVNVVNVKNIPEGVDIDMEDAMDIYPREGESLEHFIERKKHKGKLRMCPRCQSI